MKKALLISVLIVAAGISRISAQTPITTWYIIPPTSGCNGVWAIDNVTAGCGPTYMFQPNLPQACGQMAGIVADTMFIDLCFSPCTLYVSDVSGPCGICGTGVQTSIEESAALITTTYPNPATTIEGWNIWLHSPGENVTVNIYNALGELVVSENHERTDQIVHIDISNLVAGTYVAQIAVNGAVSYNQQLIVTQ